MSAVSKTVNPGSNPGSPAHSHRRPHGRVSGRASVVTGESHATDGGLLRMAAATNQIALDD